MWTAAEGKLHSLTDALRRTLKIDRVEIQFDTDDQLDISYYFADDVQRKPWSLAEFSEGSETYVVLRLFEQKLQTFLR